MFTKQQIAALQTEYSQAPERISLDAANKLSGMLDRVADLGGKAALQQLADAEIRFISRTAAARVLRWGK